MNIPARAWQFAQQMYQQYLDNQGTPANDLNAFVAAQVHSLEQQLSPSHRADILNGNANRKLTAFIQLQAKKIGIDSGLADGFWGPQTDYAFNALIHLQEHGYLPPLWRDFVAPASNPNSWPGSSESELIAFYGQPGDESQLVTVDIPYELRLAWDTSTRLTRLRCHHKVAGSVVLVLNNVLAHYGPAEIRRLRLDLFGGCYNYRRMRGGSSWSTHAWGIALDFDPDRNQLSWGRDRASFAKNDYDKWWEIWESQGWTSLGRSKNYDWMHVQATR